MRFDDHLDDDGISDRPRPHRGPDRGPRRPGGRRFRAVPRPRRPGGVNANAAITCSAVLYVFRSPDRGGHPLQHGAAAPAHDPRAHRASSSAPTSRPPRAGGNVETSQRIVDVLLGALAKAVPGRIPAASQGTMNNVAFGGYDPGPQAPFRLLRDDRRRHGRRAATAAGLSGVHTHMTNSLNTPLEALENYLPLRIRSLRPQDGLGRARGAIRAATASSASTSFAVPVDVTDHVRAPALRPLRLPGRRPGRFGPELGRFPAAGRGPWAARSTSSSDPATSSASRPRAAADTASPRAEQGGSR